MTDRTKAQDAVDAIRAQYNELEGNKDSMQALPDYGAEVLRRWDDRTARVIQANVGAIEAQKLLDVHSALRAGDHKGNLGRKVRARKVYLTALVDELRQHPEAVLERQTRTYPIVESGGISAEQVKQRLVSALRHLEHNIESNAQRRARLAWRVIRVAVVLIVLVLGGFAIKPIMTHWNVIEPFAWVISLVAAICTFFGLSVRGLSQRVERVIINLCLNHVPPQIDFDGIEAILDGRDVDEAAHREPAAEGSPKAGDVEGGSVG